jgi:WD40 repeat protein
VRVWDWLGNQLVQQFGLPGEVATVAFSPDGTTLAAGGVEAWPEAAVWTWDVATWTARHHLREYWNITSLAFSPNGRWLVGGGTSRNMRVWQAASGDEQAVLYFPGQAGHLAFSPDGRLAASSTCLESAANVCRTPAVRIWETDGWTAQTDITGFSEEVTGVEFSADGTLLFTASRDGRLRAYDPQDWGLVFEFDSGEFLMALDVSADGSQLATGNSAGALSFYRLP